MTGSHLQNLILCLWLDSKPLFPTVIYWKEALLYFSFLPINNMELIILTVWNPCGVCQLSDFTEDIVSNTPLSLWWHAVWTVLPPYLLWKRLYFTPLLHSSWPPLMGKHSHCFIISQWMTRAHRADWSYCPEVKLCAHPLHSLCLVFQKANTYHDLHWEKLVSGAMMFLFHVTPNDILI